MSTVEASASAASFYRHAWIGLAAILVLAGGSLFWAANTDIAGAVVATGTVAVEGGSKRVQHRDGGVVREILVKDGDLVAAADVLVRLDGTIAQAELTIIEAQLANALATQARLTAEATGSERLTPPVDYASLVDAGRLASLVEEQNRLRLSRAATQHGIAARLREQIAQLDVQVEGLDAQRAATLEEIDLLEREQDNFDLLLAEGLIQGSRVSALKRELARLRGEAGRLLAEVGRARAAVAESELTITQAAEEFQGSVLQELQGIEQQIVELSQQRIAALDRLAQLEVRAPQAGIVHESIVKTVGGVIGPGEILMLIVPQSDELIVEARVSPIDIDNISPGQQVRVRLSSLDARITPELDADVFAISPDLSIDAATGSTFYTVKMTIPSSELEKLPAGQTLLAGMPAEAFIQTSERTVLSYLIHPLAELIYHAFREAD